MPDQTDSKPERPISLDEAMGTQEAVFVIDHQNGLGLNEHIRVEALDQKGPGGAYHEYAVVVTGAPAKCLKISFQKGPLKEVGGVNGISQEALLAIVIHRLRCFQAGDFASRENAIALELLETAMLWIHKRTADRAARGVLGFNLK